MNLRVRARSLLTQAEAREETARRALRDRNLPYAIRSAQEAVELALKAALAWSNLEYPKQHDVSEALRRFRDRFPPWFQASVDSMAGLASETSELREAAMYGVEEQSAAVVGALRNPTEARRMVSGATTVVQSVRRLARTKA